MSCEEDDRQTSNETSNIKRTSHSQVVSTTRAFVISMICLRRCTKRGCSTICVLCLVVFRTPSMSRKMIGFEAIVEENVNVVDGGDEVEALVSNQHSVTECWIFSLTRPQYCTKANTFQAHTPCPIRPNNSTKHQWENTTESSRDATMIYKALPRIS